MSEGAPRCISKSNVASFEQCGKQLDQNPSLPQRHSPWVGSSPRRQPGPGWAGSGSSPRRQPRKWSQSSQEANERCSSAPPPSKGHSSGSAQAGSASTCGEAHVGRNSTQFRPAWETGRRPAVPSFSVPAVPGSRAQGPSGPRVAGAGGCANDVRSPPRATSPLKTGRSGGDSGKAAGLSGQTTPETRSPRPSSAASCRSEPSITSVQEDVAVASDVNVAVVASPAALCAELQRLRKSASVSERKVYFQAQCLRWHPDKNVGDEACATKMFQLLQEKKRWFLDGEINS